MKQKNTKPSTYLGINIDPALKQQIVDAASKRNTYMTEIVIEALQEWLERNEVE